MTIDSLLSALPAGDVQYFRDPNGAWGVAIYEPGSVTMREVLGMNMDKNIAAWFADVLRRARAGGSALDEAATLQRTFDLRWAADQRAIKMWQAEDPSRELIWPDHADLVVWLLERNELLAGALDNAHLTFAAEIEALHKQIAT